MSSVYTIWICIIIRSATSVRGITITIWAVIFVRFNVWSTTMLLTSLHNFFSTSFLFNFCYYFIYNFRSESVKVTYQYNWIVNCRPIFIMLRTILRRSCVQCSIKRLLPRPWLCERANANLNIAMEIPCLTSYLTTFVMFVLSATISKIFCVEIDQRQWPIV